MAGMLDLTDVLGLIVDRFNDGALPQQALIPPVHEPVRHVFPQAGNKLQTVVTEEALKQGLRQIPLVSNQFAK